MKHKIALFLLLPALLTAGCGQADSVNDDSSRTEGMPFVIAPATAAESTEAATIPEETDVPTTSESAAKATENVTEEKKEEAIPEPTDPPNETIKDEPEDPVESETIIHGKPDYPIHSDVCKPTEVPVEQKKEPPAATDAPPVTDENSSDIFARLSSLSYSPYTCDGIPEYILPAPDGTVYQLNLSSHWVWSNWSSEAYLPDDIISILLTDGSSLGMYPAQWN